MAGCLHVFTIALFKSEDLSYPECSDISEITRFSHYHTISQTGLSGRFGYLTASCDAKNSLK